MHIWVNRIISQIKIKEYPLIDASLTSLTILCLSSVPAPVLPSWMMPHAPYCAKPPSGHITFEEALSCYRRPRPRQVWTLSPTSFSLQRGIRKRQAVECSSLPLEILADHQASTTGKGPRQRFLVEQSLYSNHQAELPLFNVQRGYTGVTDSSLAWPLPQRLQTASPSCSELGYKIKWATSCRWQLPAFWCCSSMSLLNPPKEKERVSSPLLICPLQLYDLL